MNTTLGEAGLDRLARRRVGARMGWRVHALVFALVNLGLLASHLLGGAPRWQAWPLAGWGLGLAIHGLLVHLGRRTEGLRAHMLEQERERIRRGR
jgi:hypothetical protein